MRCEQIPAGSIETYGEVARRLGVPRAAKEVGEACAANAIAVAIPCHRVVRKDGGAGRLSLGRAAQARIARAGTQNRMTLRSTLAAMPVIERLAHAARNATSSRALYPARSASAAAW